MAATDDGSSCWQRGGVIRVAGLVGRFVGVGVRHYRDTRLGELPHAIEDVESLWRFLCGSFAGEPLRNATKPAIETYLHGEVKNSLPAGGPLVLMEWSWRPGGEGGGLRLMTADSDADAVSGFAIGEVLGPCVYSGADQVLVIVDTCFSGRTVPTAVEVATALLDARPPDAEHIWFGVLTSCSDMDTAVDGRLGELLRRLLTEGPTDLDLRRRWSEHNVRLRGEDPCDAVLKEWQGEDRRPSFRRDGSAWWMLPNPMFRPGAPRQVVEHLLRAARGGEPRDELSRFTGRTAEVSTVVEWVQSGQAGVFVLTGSAGTGKSAVVGRVVSLSDPDEREILLRPGRTWAHADPSPGSVTAHAHARGLTKDRLAQLIDEQLCRPDERLGGDERGRILASLDGGWRSSHELLGAVQKAVGACAAGPVVVVDGLDEARGEAFNIAREFLTELGRWATVIVSTRPVRDLNLDSEETLVDALNPRAVIDLDSDECRRAGRAAMHDYVVAASLMSGHR